MELEEVRRRILPILKRYGIRRASVFGSFARGEERDDSDIDILVEFEEGKSLLDLAGLKMGFGRGFRKEGGCLNV